MKRIAFSVFCFWLVVMMLGMVAWATPSDVYFQEILWHDGHTYAITKEPHDLGGCKKISRATRRLLSDCE